MWSEILKVLPTVDNASLNKMAQSLSSRFANVAKKFGQGITKALTFGGVAAIGASLVNRILNPLKEIQDKIDATLTMADDINDAADRFDSSVGKFVKLQFTAKALGVDPETFRTLLGKFQTRVTEARRDEATIAKAEAEKAANPNREFTPEEIQMRNNPTRAFQNERDTSEAFFQFAQALQKVSTDKRVLIQNDVFGEKIAGKASKLFSPQTDFQKTLKDVGADKPAEFFEAQAKRLGGVADLDKVLTARRELQDFGAKSRIIGNNVVTSKDEGERIALERENKRIQSYEDIKLAQIASDKILAKLEEILLQWSQAAPIAVRFGESVDRKMDQLIDKAAEVYNKVKTMNESRMLRGIPRKNEY